MSKFSSGVTGIPAMAMIECVPNFSVGRSPDIITQITEAIHSTQGVYLLHVDVGRSANRTVVTFAGAPEAVVEGAFRAIRMASSLIDMAKHEGEHPRIGATDVCPLIPLSDITMEETIHWAHQLAKRVGEELHIPVYLYENAAIVAERRNLAVIRRGGYEGLAKKLLSAAWKPDFGLAPYSASAGATVIGARNFLLAYNINLNTGDVEVAKAIAAEVRSAGNPDALPYVKAIGWYMAEYDLAQVSMNLVNLPVTPVYKVFEAVKNAANRRGIAVTGSELIGLVPLRCMLEAGRYYGKEKDRTLTDVAQEHKYIDVAIAALGLNTLKPFHPEERILEYVIKNQGASL